jgi:hypothetical protein
MLVFITFAFTALAAMLFGIALGYTAIMAILYAFGHRAPKPAPATVSIRVAEVAGD